MHLRPYRPLTAFSVASLVMFGLATMANAAGAQDKAAEKLLKDAMDNDYLATDFAKAEKKLKDALTKCGASNCSPAVLGKVHIAMGTVAGVGLGKMDQATDEFKAAIKADPDAKLDPNLTTPELTKAFAAAKGGGTGGSGQGGDEPGEKPGKKPGGDISHTPVPEQQIRTPVPVYIEIPDEIGASKVTLRYKPFGGDKWKSLEMQKMGKGFGASIPCDDVTTTGDVKYYIIAKDEAGDPAGTAGSLKDPYKVTIKQEIEGDPPTLPGKKAAEQCKPPEDCPPGLQGCPNTKPGGGGPRGDKGWGASCDQTQECQEGLACVNGSCENDNGEGGSGGSTPGKVKKNLVTLTVGPDILLISGADDVCSGLDPAYACFYQDGSGQFYGLPAKKDGTNGIQGGFGIGGGRILVSFDRQIKAGFMLGARVGFAFGGSPSSDKLPPTNDAAHLHDQAKGFFPFHGEIRASYHFGGDGVLEPKKFKPYFFLGGGAAQVNASVPVSVCDQWDANGQNTTSPSSRCPSKQPSRAVDLNAYQITGLNFIGLGGGTTIGITPNFGLAAELKVMFLLPTFGVVFAPSIGPALAF